jgi:hypothetical protein
MFRALRLVTFAAVIVIAVPSVALAADRSGSENFGLHVAVSLLGLVVAVVLLVQALAVRNLAKGGVVANKISYVVLAVVCLAASALAAWSTNFVAGLTLEQAGLASELLVIFAMVLLALYFASVGATLRQYLQSLTDRLSPAKSEGAPVASQDDRA